MFGFMRKAGENMEEKNISAENEIQKLTPNEMEQVDGGSKSMVDPEIKCKYCYMCFNSQVELMLHYKKCLANPANQNKG